MNPQYDQNKMGKIT